MKTIRNEEIHDELARAHAQLGEVYNAIYRYQLRATMDNTPEGCMFAATMRKIQTALAEARHDLHFTACCYASKSE